MATWLVGVLVAALSLSLSADAFAQPAPLIAYESLGDIKLVKPDGTERRVLARSSDRTFTFGPAWSPSGESVGFVRKTDPDDPSDRKEVSRLTAVDLATGVSRTLASNAGYGGLAFSPDGGSVVYGAEVLVGGEEFTNALHVVSANGSSARALTKPGANDADYQPAWSPDGTTIAFTRASGFEESARIGVWTIPAGGGEPRLLVADAEDPAWSPDGTQLAFATTRDRNGTTCFHDCSPNREIYVAEADGSNARRLTFTETDESAPAWSPDATQIAFHSARPRPEGNDELYAMRADGGCVTQLTNTSVANREPAWRPGAAYGAPLECDGAVPGAAMPTFETDLTDGLLFRRFPIPWLGPSIDGLLLSDVDVHSFVTLFYDDCGLVGAACPVDDLQVQTTSICRRHPLRYGGYSGPGQPDLGPHVTRYRRVGPALLADHPSGPEVYTGNVTTTLFEPTFEGASAIARRLTTFPRSRSALKAPRFSARTLARVRRVRGELRRLGMRELSRRWRMSTNQIRAAVKLRGVLRPSELRRGTSHC